MDEDSCFIDIKKCFVCFKNRNGTIGPEESLSSIDGKGVSSEETVLRKELMVVFLSKKFFSIPEETCCQFLQKYGNPSSWIYWCDSCSVLVDEAKKLFDQVTLLEKKMNILKRKLLHKISSSDQSVQSKYTKPKDDLTENIRTIILQMQNAFPNFTTVKKEIKCETFSLEEEENSFEYTHVSDPERVVSNHSQGSDHTSDDNNDESLSFWNTNEEVTKNGREYDPLKVTSDPFHSKLKNNYHTCVLCSKRFSTEEKLKSHQLKSNQSCHKRKPKPSKNVSYNCSVCDEEFKNIKDLKFHKKLHHRKTSFTCSHCGKIFSKNAYLRQHLIVHSDSEERCFQCSTCGKTFRYKHSLSHHENIHKQDNPFRCSICAKNLSCSHSLSEHMKIHNGERKEKIFLCTNCGLSFSSNSALSAHEKVHTGERPHVCTFCGMKFAQKGNKISHERIHKGENPFPCSFCEERFKYKISLRRHLRTHTGEPPPHQCSFCDRRFETEQETKTHERKHTGEKPYSCAICGKGFTVPASRAKHISVVHDKAAGQYSCSICEKRFQTAYHVKRHEKTHLISVQSS